MSSPPPVYSRAFYEELHAGSSASAKVVLTHVKELLQPELPRCVVDVGCGDGSWLESARQVLGAERILGLDGRAVQDANSFRLKGDQFIPIDLERGLSSVGNSLPPFDLAMCLEVAEHLPATCARFLVDDLCRLAPLVLFSAAVPGQGGVHHINEQWPSYWIPMFAASGLHCVDALRRGVWSVSEVKWWYRQNLLLFVSESGLRRWTRLRTHLDEDRVPSDFDLIHPDFYRTLLSRGVRRASLLRRLAQQLWRFRFSRHAG